MRVHLDEPTLLPAIADQLALVLAHPHGVKSALIHGQSTIGAVVPRRLHDQHTLPATIQVASPLPHDRPAPPEPYSPRARSPYRARSPAPRSPPRRRESPPREREYTNGAPPPSAPTYRSGDDTRFSRAPPSGPGASRNFSTPAMSPPVGPSTSTVPISAHNRASNPILSAPSRPRGGGPPRGGYGRDPYYERDYAGGPPPPPRRTSSAYHGGPPPRGGYGGPGGLGGPPSGPRGPLPYAPPFRGSSNSTSTTYPRTQRFNGPPSGPGGAAQQHLEGLAKEVPGGQRAPEVFDSSKLNKLEEEARRLRELIAEKQARKRGGVREWERLGREAENAGLRAELAEGSLRVLSGEEGVGGAAF
ncbi:hypothetical protein H2201_004438 [Coniosporium apollinis]|uniref:Uncharacterized protein n=1 Tax=Coniosporium apollinis TaxID=61459 RepID=A0ABQ9NWH0_9PEZI|nr:hypothetical protein H2201_004438 [Coniosporium apollinis]